MKRYIAKNKAKIRNTFLGKHLSNTSELIDGLKIETVLDVDTLICNLEYMLNKLNEKFNHNSVKSNLSSKLFEKRMLNLEMLIDEVSVSEARFRNDEEELEEVDDYDEQLEEMAKEVEYDILESLYSYLG